MSVVCDRLFVRRGGGGRGEDSKGHLAISNCSFFVERGQVWRNFLKNRSCFATV